ncbi:MULTISPECIES: helix-turn-helix transcriptional regulator [unclassified Acinetobacter]|uniref:helix-turn-helix domain-containing protein n=1 Tax=unclassified Acinetobacter TaxID=196816 RepID=UPI002934BC85|nr:MULTISPECIES: helix-turn-helix transcriptional regulator [unclassified Acinetobacter]WOE32572.1 helix-turn-helix transcriptional regulator [Acinetobacter sp. SAAs470]WOE38047.1 helix-turn-helix transcriptional regulator [Acinetobacter sp. SAAs474]
MISKTHNTTHFFDLVALMGHQNFDSSLLMYLEQWIHAKHFSILRIKNEIPTLLLCGSYNDHHRVPLRCGQSYIKHYHAYDELYQQLLSQHLAEQQTVTGQVCANDILYSAYRREIYEKNHLIQRLCGFYRDAENHPVLFNLYRHKEQGFYSDHEIINFQQMIPALAKLIQGHLALAAQCDVKLKLLDKQPNLAPQELEVCRYILKGMSYTGIAAQMGLKESTVKTYRNRAFEKLGIHFKNQLFSMFLLH